MAGMKTDVQLEKLLIRGEDGAVAGQEVHAMYNPKEIGIDKTVPWKQQDKAEGDAPPQEFTTGQPRTLSFDLMFDAFEQKNEVHEAKSPADHDVYAQFVSKLEKFVMIDKGLKRPPMVTAAWSKSLPSGDPAFKGVIASMNVKYTMFMPDGTPCRCTVTVKMTEAKAAVYKGKDSKKKGGSKTKAPAKGTQIKQGERIDQAAGGDYRPAADAAGIDNPRQPGNGTTIPSGGS